MPIRITGLNSGLDTDAIVQELVSAYKTKTQKYEKAQTKLSWKQDAWKEMNTKIYGFYSKSLWNMSLSGNYNKKSTVVSDSTKAKVTAGSNVVNGTQKLSVQQLATAGYLTGTELKLNTGGKLSSSTLLGELGVKDGTLKFKVGDEEKEIEVTSDMKMSDFTAALKEQGINANFDEGQQRLFLSASASGKDNDFSFVVENQDTLDMLTGLGLATEEDYKAVNKDATEEELAQLDFADKEAAANAIIKLNGATFESSSNKFSINGMEITVTGTNAPGEEMTITTETDVDGIYNMIKDFFKEYNELVNSMEKAFNAKTSKGYEPLTDDEKEEMSDAEIEKWESKIKDSLLRRDDSLSSVLSGMANAMTKSFEIGGKTFNLSSFGINTAGYFTKAENESYAYHINGNEDDASVSGNEDKLRKAIQQDPDSVMDFFSKLAKGVYDNLHEKMGSTSMSSIYTVYNDKQMQKEYDDYTKTIKKWEEKSKAMEDYYYKQFSAMETALAKLQSQTNSLSSLLGG